MVFKVNGFTAVPAVILLCLLSCCHCKRGQECSQFNFLEQLLDKMVRTEVKFEEMQTQVDESLKQVQLALSSFEEANNKRDAEISELINAQVEKVVNDALKELPHEDELSIPTIVFHARDVTDTTVNTDEKYVFTNVIYNYEDGYDAASGMFTAPVNGTYMFTLNLCVSGTNHVCYDIVVSDESLARGVEYEVGGGNPCNAIDAIVVLEAGQEVWVEATCPSVLTTDYYRWNSFAGALLHTT